MAEFDEKLNSLLSNPDAMSQIMQLAQSLSGGEKQESPPPPPQTAPPFSLGDLLRNGQQAAQERPHSGVSQAASSSSGGDLLSSLSGGMDPGLMLKLLPLVQELGAGQDSHARQLLYALRPYLREERQEKVERALQLARLFHIGKKFLSSWEG